MATIHRYHSSKNPSLETRETEKLITVALTVIWGGIIIPIMPKHRDRSRQTAIAQGGEFRSVCPQVGDRFKLNSVSAILIPRQL